MPKKKKLKSKKAQNSFFKTRKGFYSLVVILVLLMVSTIKLVASISQEAVLGEADQEIIEKREKEKKEKRHEERKEEIKREFDVDAEKVQVKFENEEGNLKRKVETKTIPPREFKIEKEEALIQTVEEEFKEEQKVEIEPDDSAVSLKKNGVESKSGFPLSIDVATNELTVTKRDGTTKTVAVLPDAAIANFMRHKKVELLNIENTNSSTSATIAAQNEENDTEKTEIKLIEKDSELVYEIKGKKKLKALGFIPVTADTTGYVSAESGEIVSHEEPLVTKILNLVSF